MDHENRELLGNILGLLEIMKKDIKVIKQDIYVMNSRQEGSKSSRSQGEEGNCDQSDDQRSDKN